MHSRCHCAIRSETPTHPSRKMMSGRTSYPMMMKGEGKQIPQLLTLQRCRACTEYSTCTTETCEPCPKNCKISSLSFPWWLMQACSCLCVTVCFPDIYLLAQMVHPAESAKGQDVQLESQPSLWPRPSAATRLCSTLWTTMLRHPHAACS